MTAKTEKIRKYYEGYDEDERFEKRYNLPEYMVTTRYIHRFAEELGAKKILEIGAASGRYSIALAEEGFDVTAVELLQHHINIFKEKMGERQSVDLRQGDARDLSMFTDNTFDMTLVLGPLYHLPDFNDRVKAMQEALRVTKPGGIVMVAYCMVDSAMLKYVFQEGGLRQSLDVGEIDLDTWTVAAGKTESPFVLVRTEDITALNEAVGAERIMLIGTDGLSILIRNEINTWDDFTMGMYMDCMFTVCERQDMVGISNHTLDILRKAKSNTTDGDKNA